MDLSIHYRQGGATVLQRAVKVAPSQIHILDQNLIAPATEEKGPSVHKTLPNSDMAVIPQLIFRGLMIIGLSRTWSDVSNIPHTVLAAATIVNSMSSFRKHVEQ